MLKKTIGVIIFILAVFFQIGQDNFFNFFDKQMLAFIASAAMGLFIATYKKEMSFTFCMKKLKSYVIYAGWAGALIAAINGIHRIGTPETVKNIFVNQYKDMASAIILPIFWGYIIAVFIDIFIREE